MDVYVLLHGSQESYSNGLTVGVFCTLDAAMRDYAEKTEKKLDWEHMEGRFARETWRCVWTSDIMFGEGVWVGWIVKMTLGE